MTDTCETPPPPLRNDGTAGGNSVSIGKFAIVLAVALTAAYPDVVFGWKSFGYRDYGVFGFPLAEHLHRSVREGLLFPQWTSLSCCGIPYLGQWNTLVLYPGSALYMLLPPSVSLPYFCLGHLFLGGIGMFLLARRWTGSGFAAAVSGLAFAFNGLSLHFLMWPNNVAAYAWMPIFIMCFDGAAKEGGIRIVHAALAGAVQLLAGAPEIIILTWVLAGIIALLHIDGKLLGTVATILRVAAIWLLAVLLASAQLLPFLRLLHHSHRSTSYASDMDWSMPGTGWANFLVPLFRTFSARQQVRWQPDQSWTSSYYAGIIVVALAVTAIIAVRNRRVGALAVATCLSLIFALGAHSPVYPLLMDTFPVLGFIRFPVKYVILAVFCLPLLAGFAIAGLTENQSPAAAVPLRRRHLFRVFAGTVGALLLCIGAILCFGHAARLPYEIWGETISSGLTRGALLVAATAAIFILREKRDSRSRVSLAAVVVFLMTGDILSHMSRQNPTIGREPALLGSLAPHREMAPVPSPGTSRALVTVKAAREMQNKFTDSLESDLLIVRLGLHDNCNLIEGIPKTGGFFSLYPEPSYQALAAMHTPPYPAPEKLLDFLGVSQISSEKNCFDWTRRETAMPMATAGQRVRYASPAETVRHLYSDDFAPADDVFLPPEAEKLVGDRPRTKAVLGSVVFSTQAIAMQVTAEAPTVVVVAQSFYPAWKARVDGEPAPVFQANHGFQAIPVPPGSHQVELRYRDSSFTLGAGLSLATLAMCMISILVIRNRAPKRAT